MFNTIKQQENNYDQSKMHPIYHIKCVMKRYHNAKNLSSTITHAMHIKQINSWQAKHSPSTSEPWVASGWTMAGSSGASDSLRSMRGVVALCVFASKDDRDLYIHH